MATMTKLTDEQMQERHRLFLIAEANARRVLKPGDRIRVTKCPGTKRWATFAGWDGHWIVSKSGINDYAPGCVDMVNDMPVDFKEPKAQSATLNAMAEL